jgi:hypothetical protein
MMGVMSQWQVSEDSGHGRQMAKIIWQKNLKPHLERKPGAIPPGGVCRMGMDGGHECLKLAQK